MAAKLSDMGDVVPTVPGVKEKQPIDGARAVFGMDKDAAELVGGVRSPESNPTIMKRIEQGQ
jgi:hypothetical protein